MFVTLFLAAAVGQVRSCQTAASYRQQAVASYAAPAYSYNYAATYAAPYVETKFVAVYDDPYYAQLVGQQVRAELKAKDELKGAVELSQQVANLSAQVGQLAARIGGQAPTPPGPTPPVPAKPTPNPNPAPGVDDGSVPPPPPVPPPNPAPTGPDADVLSILTNGCAKCHTAPAKAGKGFVLFDAPGKLASLSPLDLLLIDHQTYSGAMPKNAAEPMPPEDYSKLRAWISQSQEDIEAAIKACKQKNQ